MPDLRPPFVYYGSKYRVAPAIWSALGDVDDYREPFGGSLANLLRRPEDHRRRLETVNDSDGFISNFFRALATDPEGVVRHCDFPVNENDLTARHAWLVNSGRDRVARLEVDPEFFDVKVAGWWVWGINSWMGSGWCSGDGSLVIDEGKLVEIEHRGNGNGRGIKRQRPHLGFGQGTNRVGFSGAQRRENLLAYFNALADRLRGVRVCCGDWTRLLVNNGGSGKYGHGGIHGVYSTGVFLDPPYLGTVRETGIYRHDSPRISIAVRKWALSHGADPRMRIVLAGCWNEHGTRMPKSWRVHECGKGKRYGMTAETNKQRECLWMSPGCEK